MTRKEYNVEGRNFRTESDYKRALRDKETIEKLRAKSAGYDKEQLMRLQQDLTAGKYPFFTLLGQDFADETADRIRQCDISAKSAKGGRHSNERGLKQQNVRAAKASGESAVTKVTDEAVRAELKAQEKRRKWMIGVCAIVATACLGYFVIYTYFIQRTEAKYDQLIALKEKSGANSSAAAEKDTVVIHYTNEGDRVVPDVLDEYKDLLNKNRKLIGWLKIDDTVIDYPVMQTSDNEYYLDHNLNQEYDKNGSIFMDKDCDVLKPSTNLILYGHHMQSGKMFGSLPKYSSKDYYEKHKYIYFDTIYEKGVYEIMYVFRSRVYNEQEVVFKYYQFIEANSEQEFDSNMREMAEDALYDTGVTAKYGDRLLTLSTCDYQEKNGRFVVVAKKVP